MKKAFALILSCVLMMSFMLPVRADVQNKQDKIFVGEMPSCFLKELQTLGIQYSNTSIIEEITIYKSYNDYMFDQNGLISVCIYDVNAERISRNVLFFSDEDGDLLNVSIEDIKASVSKSSNYGQYANYAVIVSTTATYDIVVGAGNYWRYRPISVAFSFMVKSGYSASQVGDITTTYQCGGALQTYPGYTTLDSTYIHTISRYHSSPSMGVEYSSSNPLPSTRVIDIGTGLFQSHFVYVTGYYGSSYFEGFASNFS